MSRSESRLRRKSLRVRLFDEEYGDIAKRAEDIGCSAAELVRAVMFNRAPVIPSQCSDKHQVCNPQHHSMVNAYRDQRRREELAYESTTSTGWSERNGHGKGEHQPFKEGGVTMVTFRDWLRHHKIGDKEEAERNG